MSWQSTAAWGPVVLTVLFSGAVRGQESGSPSQTNTPDAHKSPAAQKPTTTKPQPKKNVARSKSKTRRGGRRRIEPV